MFKLCNPGDTVIFSKYKNKSYQKAASKSTPYSWWDRTPNARPVRYNAHVKWLNVPYMVMHITQCTQTRVCHVMTVPQCSIYGFEASNC